MNKYRPLEEREIATMMVYGCSAEDWKKITVAEEFKPDFITNVQFSGTIKLGYFDKIYELPGGIKKHAGISDCSLHNCSIGNNVFIDKVHHYIANYDIGDNCFIKNVNSIFIDGKSRFGNGVLVPVMNEGGGREIPIFDYLSASLAYILALYRHRPQLIEQLNKQIEQYALLQESSRGSIGEYVTIINCGTLKDLRIGSFARITGASNLENGSINSNEEAPVEIGSGVKCNDFIVCSGVSITDSTLLSKCFIGQGTVLGKHYSALDSLFFSNCQGMHGEATAIFAGPYTVSHHKSSLLIAGMFSFLNAGSGSNQSNHMYKLGPIHQGIAERGAKTTSNSYLLWPARIGAFTLVMGRHTMHSDTSSLPFSYLIENATESFLAPAVNLRSVGTVRDAQKWPKRDNRKDSKKLDLINFNLLSPYTIQKMMTGIKVLEELQSLSGAANDTYIYQNCKIKRNSLERGIKLYKIAICKFLGNSLLSRLGEKQYESMDELRKQLSPKANSIGLGEWADLSGLIAPKSEVQRLMNDTETDTLELNEIQERFVEMHENYYDYEWAWAFDKLLKQWNLPLEKLEKEDLILFIKQWKESVVGLDQMLYKDAKKEFDLNSKTGFGIDGDERQKHLDFESVRGSFEKNPFVLEILNHIERKSKLADEAIERLKKTKE